MPTSRDDLDLLRVGLRLNDADRFLDDAVEHEVLEVEHHASGLDPRHVENVVDDAEQVGAALVDVAAILLVLGRAELAEHARLHDLREADDGVERRAELVADIGQELRLGAVGVLGAVLLLGVFLGELDHLLRLKLELLARLAKVGDGRHQSPLAVDQLGLVALQLRDVGADRDEAAVLGAALVDLQPAAVLELQLEAPRAFLRATVGDDLGTDQRLPPGGDDVGIGRAGNQRRVRHAVELLVLRVAHHEAVVGVPEDEGLGDGLDRVAEADVGGLRTLDQPHLLGHVDGDADEVRLAAVAVDQLGAGAEPDPAAVGMAHAEHAVDGRLALVVEGLGKRHQVAVVGMDEAGDLAEAEQVVALVLADDLEHRARPEHAAPCKVPVPQAAAAAHQRRLEALVGLGVDRVGLDGAARLGEVAVEDDEQDGAGADEDGDVERDVGPPVVEHARDRHDDRDGARARRRCGGPWPAPGSRRGA